MLIQKTSKPGITIIQLLEMLKWYFDLRKGKIVLHLSVGISLGQKDDMLGFIPISWDPSQLRTIPNPDHPPLKICLTYKLFCTKKEIFCSASRYTIDIEILNLTFVVEFRIILISESESNVSIGFGIISYPSVANIYWNVHQLSIFRPEQFLLAFLVGGKIKKI